MLKIYIIKNEFDVTLSVPKQIRGVSMSKKTMINTKPDKGEIEVSFIINLVQDQYPECKDVIDSLKALPFKGFFKRSYVSFQKPSANAVIDSLSLECEKEGTLVLDVGDRGDVIGIEFIKLIPLDS